ncbi:MAG: N-acetylmuramoyl-L-alanine amidase, partial [Erysipelotrichia bacterium]|nr:N-acetylmuramoyl-L-alanine amidase [Erysipelotrichia bacterium]
MGDMMKRKNKYLASGIVFLCVLAFFFLNLIIPSIPVIMMSNNNKEGELPLIILDAGHGGMDGGASSRSGIPEKDINLSIVKYLKEYLLLFGFNVITTRESDQSLHTTEKTIKAQKSADLETRLKIINQNLNAIVVSIHLNSFPQSHDVKGAQVFYSKNDDQSKILGELTQATLVEVLDKTNHRLAKKSYDTIYLMKNALNTSILVECGFLSNDHEAALLTDD